MGGLLVHVTTGLSSRVPT